MKSSLILTLGAVALLAACSDGNGISEDQSDNNNGNGGGAGGAGGDAGITAANAIVVTRVTYESALSAGVAAEFSGVTGVVAVELSPISKIDGSFATSILGNSATGNVPIPPTAENCLVSGISTLSGEIADPFTPTFTQGDYFDILFSDCDDGFSVVNGSLYYLVDAFNGDLLLGTYDLTMTATLTDFQVTTAEDSLLSNGDVTVRLNSAQLPTVTAETSGTSLTVDGNNHSVLMTNFAGSYSQDLEAVPSPFNQSSSGTMDNTLLPGVVDYSTPVPFTGFDGEYPSAGEFLVVGENSSARLVAQDNVNIIIQVDGDGDGEVDSTIETTWAELEGS
jgi:hypothetical protein